MMSFAVVGEWRPSQPWRRSNTRKATPIEKTASATAEITNRSRRALVEASRWFHGCVGFFTSCSWGLSTPQRGS